MNHTASSAHTLSTRFLYQTPLSSPLSTWPLYIPALPVPGLCILLCTLRRLDHRVLDAGIADLAASRAFQIGVFQSSVTMPTRDYSARVGPPAMLQTTRDSRGPARLYVMIRLMFPCRNQTERYTTSSGSVHPWDPRSRVQMDKGPPTNHLCTHGSSLWLHGWL